MDVYVIWESPAHMAQTDLSLGDSLEYVETAYGPAKVSRFADCEIYHLKDRAMTGMTSEIIKNPVL